MWGWLAPIIEAILKVLVAPREQSATSEAERAGAAETRIAADDVASAQLDQALAARDRADRGSDTVVGPNPAGGPTVGLPDDGFRRD